MLTFSSCGSTLNGKKLGSEKFSLTKGLSFERVTKGGKKKKYIMKHQ